MKGYASHGESWSFALALRLASYDLLRVRRRRPDPDPRRRLRRARQRTPRAARRPGRRRRAGAGHRGGARGRAGRAGRGPLRRGRRAGDPRWLTRRPTHPSRRLDPRLLRTSPQGRRPRPGPAADPGHGEVDAGRPASAGPSGTTGRATPRSRVRTPTTATRSCSATRSTGWSPTRLGARAAGARRLRPLARAGRRRGRRALHARVVRRRPARGPHRLDGLGHPADPARADGRTPPQRGARRRAP